MSHLGRPEGAPDPQFSLKPVADHLGTLLEAPVVFCDSTVGEAAEACVAGAPAGAVVLLENTRFLPGETDNDPELAAQMARLGDVFVSDAFGSVHRAHASTEGVAHLLPHAAGRLLAREVEFLTTALDAPERPFVAVLGGAKVSDKIGVIEALAPKVDQLVVGGANGLHVPQGAGPRRRRVEGGGRPPRRGAQSARALRRHDRAAGRPHRGGPLRRRRPRSATSPATSRTAGWASTSGRETQARYAEIVLAAKTVVWNGPMGVFEMAPFAAGTLTVAHALAAATGAGALTVIGGGDSVAAIEQAGLADAVSHVSTGGGAMLELLEGQTLPGLAALDD